MPIVAERAHAMLSAHKHEIKFTHNQMRPKNILFKDGHISAIINWAHSGWFPEYWEYTTAMTTYNRRQDWNAILDNAIGRPPCELAIIEKFRRLLTMDLHEHFGGAGA